MTTFNVSSASQLRTALSSASGGDVILLQSGNYGSFDFNNIAFSDYVTVRSADGNDGAMFTHIGVSNSSYLRIDGVHVSDPSNGSSTARVVGIENGSHHVEFINSEVNGLVDSNYLGFYGILTLDSHDITIRNNYVHDVHDAILGFESSNLVISDNIIDFVGRNGFKFGGIDQFTIENNSEVGHVYPETGEHVDFLQFQGSSSNGVIEGNVYLAQTTGVVQGIFLADGTYNNILINENIIYTGMINGLVVYEGSGICCS
jgi:hypothetical protein